MQRRNVRSRRKISDYKENCFERWREERRSVDNYQRVNPVWKWMMRGKPRMQDILHVHYYKNGGGLPLQTPVCEKWFPRKECRI